MATKTKSVRELQVRAGMDLQPGEQVEVYYNIQKGGFSIVSRDKRNPNKGKVVAYAGNVLIKDATFHINSNKLAQIHERQRKTVYAVVRGTFVHAEKLDNSDYLPGYCNPYTTGKFIDWHTKEELTKAQYVCFYDKFFAYKGAR